MFLCVRNIDFSSSYDFVILDSSDSVKQGQISTRLYNKGDDFNIGIINLHNVDSNIPATRSYGAYISQIIPYTRICTLHSDF
jgi:hypothetical protein